MTGREHDQDVDGEGRQACETQASDGRAPKVRIDWRLDRRDIDDGGIDGPPLTYKGVPFTGEVVEAIGDQLLWQDFYVDGYRHGLAREWWADGPLMAEGLMVWGHCRGVFRSWNHDGTLAKEQVFDDEEELIEVREDFGPARPDALPRSCPQCGQDLVQEITRYAAYGGHEGTDEWWRCPGCGFLGRPDLGGRSILHPFVRPTGEDGDCVFCGGEECNRASETFVRDGWLCGWIVCVACGRENVRRIKRVR
ncbi:toxin-antitoxin system YwqK family antitoxin [Amycolatopsis rhizosphaerae]|uniref:toxin-antitoxin system YwqK family antitoxin n=1 Tax=Amycolatopsis rhizosphaerae TaxID=2053003 RepID=UPI0011A67840|nr:hypothetical protein [Amycolatopsis rhizosphaerae]